MCCKRVLVELSCALHSCYNHLHTVSLISVYQYSNMAPRTSRQISIFDDVFFVSVAVNFWSNFIILLVGFFLTRQFYF